MKFLFRTDGSSAQLFIRLALALVIFPHGAQKVLGWFDGAGFHKTVEMFVGAGMPEPMAWLLMAIEFVGAAFLFFGFFTRICAFGIGGSQAICALMNHVQNGFFMNWAGTKAGEGFEYHILTVGIALALVFKGGGFLSIDRAMTKEKKH
jgi:putative oxidoreductase